MPVYKVGELFHPNRRAWPEGVEYQFIAGEHHLNMFFDSPTPNEIKAITRGTARFALVVQDDLILLLYRFGAVVTWSDAPYSWHMVPADQRVGVPADVAEGLGALLTIMLIDASSGILKGIRAIGLSTEFTNALHAAIRNQAARPFDQSRYDDQLHRLYVRYPKTDLLLSLARVTYSAGDPPAGTPRGRPR